mmetsp:Transcript_3543/g.12726  ORF Transcript_3543/g.12726 Transcript_3543/m.12726 type:complete len:668 (+) Transcript_3543:105-2108(+)|eukprot:CAMPEP_0170135628 /NCGR_PEP_ID=MMETSP0033_2-20121228/2572_1 /TAXON_ID=195969 /ORGANISM="Dolichomastix tenuilepis, Strain CCMP3274" /LENGTH=667 /DNA_ID=CAMNT_0010371231 /DNA_START=82 /DNA_END=2085 /DNA_ORIENTATION=+
MQTDTTTWVCFLLSAVVCALWAGYAFLQDRVLKRSTARGIGRDPERAGLLEAELKRPYEEPQIPLEDLLEQARLRTQADRAVKRAEGLAMEVAEAAGAATRASSANKPFFKVPKRKSSKQNKQLPPPVASAEEVASAEAEAETARAACKTHLLDMLDRASKASQEAQEEHKARQAEVVSRRAPDRVWPGGPKLTAAGRIAWVDNAKFLLVVLIGVHTMFGTFASDYNDYDTIRNHWQPAIDRLFIVPVAYPTLAFLCGFTSQGEPTPTRWGRLAAYVIFPYSMMQITWGLWYRVGFPSNFKMPEWAYAGMFPNPLIVNWPLEYMWFIASLFQWRQFIFLFHNLNVRVLFVLVWVVSMWSGYFCSLDPMKVTAAMEQYPMWLELSLARTLSYLPFFTMGFLMHREWIKFFSGALPRLVSGIAIAILIVLFVMEQYTVGGRGNGAGVSAMQFLLPIYEFADRTFAEAWTQSLFRPFSEFQVGNGPRWGVYLLFGRRFIAHILSLSQGCCLLTLVPQREIWFTQAGNNYIIAYLLHPVGYLILQQILEVCRAPTTFPFGGPILNQVAWGVAVLAVFPYVWFCQSWPMRYVFRHLVKPKWAMQLWEGQPKMEPDPEYDRKNARLCDDESVVKYNVTIKRVEDDFVEESFIQSKLYWGINPGLSTREFQLKS